MDEKNLLLDRRIRKDVEVMEKIWDELATVDLAGEDVDEKDLIFVGYRLHNLYNAAENVFKNIAGAFGNHIGGSGGWHSELLERMCLDLLPLRPAVIDETTLDQLDELRRFRHLFRAAYSTKLDAERLALVLKKALALRHGWTRQIEDFLAFVAKIT